MHAMLKQHTMFCTPHFLHARYARSDNALGGEEERECLRGHISQRVVLLTRERVQPRRLCQPQRRSLPHTSLCVSLASTRILQYNSKAVATGLDAIELASDQVTFNT